MLINTRIAFTGESFKMGQQQVLKIAFKLDRVSGLQNVQMPRPNDIMEEVISKGL